MRDDATADANLSGWIASGGRCALPAASAASASASDGMPGWNDGPGRRRLPASAASAAAAADAGAVAWSRWRTRLTQPLK